ncbi:MAG: glycosyltransferase [Gammaproteobacteria bacterium]|nr:glycosyltransferase [Gammaproteobacteria bacterium]
MHMIDRLPPDGAERLIAEVLKNRSARYDFQVLCLVEGGLLVDEIEKSGVPVTVLGRRNGHDLQHARRLYHWLRENKPKVVHTHLFTADAWGRTFAWLARVPGIFSTVHSTNAWKSGLHVTVDRLLAYFSDAVIACTEEVKTTIARQGIPEKKLVTIFNGVDLQRIESASVVDVRSEFSLAGDMPVFALVGRLHEAKGHMDLIPELQTLAEQGYRFACLFVGEGELETSLKQEVQARGLEEYVVFTGFRQDVIGILKAVDFLVMPSRWEGLPISLLESMACGTPVIASRVGGIPDVIQHGEDGFLVGQGDGEALREAIVTLLEDKPLRDSLGAAGKRKISEHYSAASVAQAYEALYDKVV